MVFFDRMIIKGHIRQFFSPSGKRHFLSENNILLKDFSFGFMHVKLQTWFPFLIQVYINGREMMKHIFDENGISYRMYDNSFFEISEWPLLSNSTRALSALHAFVMAHFISHTDDIPTSITQMSYLFYYFLL